MLKARFSRQARYLVQEVSESISASCFILFHSVGSALLRGSECETSVPAHRFKHQASHLIFRLI